MTFLVMIWLNRSLLCYSGTLAVSADLGLCLVSAIAVYGILVDDNSIIRIIVFPVVAGITYLDSH
jgi:hypothetical protein